MLVLVSLLGSVKIIVVVGDIIFSMHRVRDQQGRFIISSKNPHKDNNIGHSQKGKDPNQLNYLSPTKGFHIEKRHETSTQEFETIQGSMKTKVPPLEGFIREQYHSREFIFPKVPSEMKTTLRGR